VIFSESSLDRAAEQGGKYECPSCGRNALFLVTEVEGPPGDEWEFEYCPAKDCRSNPLRMRWIPRQPKLPIEV